jgi:hypothetical protein
MSVFARATERAYCSQCHQELKEHDYNERYGWCEHCRDSIEVTHCKVPFWVVALTAEMVWLVQLSF